MDIEFKGVSEDIGLTESTKMIVWTLRGDAGVQLL